MDAALDVAYVILLDRARERDSLVELMSMWAAPDSGLRTHFVEDLLEALDPSDDDEPVAASGDGTNIIQLAAFVNAANACM